MSVQFGRWNFDGRPVDPEYIDKVDALLAPFGPDGRSPHYALGTTILYHAFHTTKESRREKQPHISASGAVITWDGRLDNRSELIRELADVLTASSTDVEIVTAAYEEWGKNCFAKLIGDWALSIWNPATRSLILAKDVIGTRHLYYAVEEAGITWSTILDPLVLLAGHKFNLCEEYIAGWLGFFPATHLTPYIGIDSVPPSSFVRLQPGKREIQKYWDFDPHKRIRYRTDAEYEEHFRIVFGEAVRRRLRSDSPVLGELSGGMDSSSIVCMADEIIARGMAETPRLDTISYYDDSEPNWNERPYFSQVEKKRGRAGSHINVWPNDHVSCPSKSTFLAAAPGSNGGRENQATREFRHCLNLQGYRVILSGIGGDEVAGGVPTAMPELMDLLARARLKALSCQLKGWALSSRKPWIRLFFQVVAPFFPPLVMDVPKHMRPGPWLQPAFARQFRLALRGYPSRVHLFGCRPSLQENRSTLEALRRQLACTVQGPMPLYEKRYPLLDRRLLEFLYAIPREQLLRPMQRRSLIRRSLRGIVPEEILGRRRKAFVERAMRLAILPDHVKTRPTMVIARLGIIDAYKFSEALEAARRGAQAPSVPLLRALALESWICQTTLTTRLILRDDPGPVAVCGLCDENCT